MFKSQNERTLKVPNSIQVLMNLLNGRTTQTWLEYAQQKLAFGGKRGEYGTELALNDDSRAGMSKLGTDTFDGPDSRRLPLISERTSMALNSRKDPKGHRMRRR
jgi:hypothetical protein